MKSLNKEEITYKLTEKFTHEIISHIKNEGFVINNNNSYCYNLYNTDWQDKCYYKNVESSGYTINVYIFENGIGVDFDYDCGGNSFTRWFSFDDCTFESAYDSMVDTVNSNK